MRFETQSPDTFSVPGGQIDQPALPAFRQRGGLLVDGIDVETKAFVKRGVDANHVEPCRTISIFRGDQIDLERSQDFVGDVRALAVKGLTPDDDKLLLSGDAPRCAQRVVNL